MMEFLQDALETVKILLCACGVLFVGNSLYCFLTEE